MSDSQDAPELRELPAMRVIAREHRGSHDEIGSVYRELHAWAKRKGVVVSGPARTIFQDPPSDAIPESALYTVCVPVRGEVTGEGDVHVRELPAETVYVYRHKGPYSEIAARYTELLAWVASMQYEVSGKPFEVYLAHLDAAGGGDASQLVTEICLPVSV